MTMEAEKRKEQVNKRYSLRHRNEITLNDDFYYFDMESDTERQKKKKIFCSFCKTEFGDRNSLKTHKERRSDFYCNCCDSNFCSLELLSDHISSGSCLQLENSPFCRYCGELFDSKVSLRKHVAKYHTQTKSRSTREVKTAKKLNYKCNFCKKIIINYNTLRRHIKNHLKQDYSTETSRQNFTGMQQRKLHQTVSINYKCDLCSQNFPSVSSFSRHTKNKVCLRYKTCHFCKKTFKSTDLIEKHILKFHMNNTVSCSKCQNIFVDKADYKKHICEKSEIEKYDCEICGNKYNLVKKLKLHILNEHHGITYQCQICFTKFVNQELLDKHVGLRKCKVESPSTCNICGKVFSKKDYLKKHQYMHSETSYKCRFCYCVFIKESSYNRHVSKLNCSNNARREKLQLFNFKFCRLCNIEYVSEEDLIAHFKELHQDMNPHQCFCCDDTFLTYAILQEHVYQHNLQKYTCSLCGKMYSSQEGFRKHRLKHKGQHYKCSFCDSAFLKENRYRFHVKSCKKNPANGYTTVDLVKPERQKNKQKQRRQLNWESRIIMKHLRGDPNSANFEDSKDIRMNGVKNNYFDDSESDSKSDTREGWFDKYYEEFDLDFQDGSNNKDKLEAGMDRPSNKVASHLDDDFNDAASRDIDDNSHDSVGEVSVSSEDSDSSRDAEDFGDVPAQYNSKMCRLCSTEFTHEYELLHHFIKSHPGQSAHKCPKCQHECPLYAQLQEHWKVHGMGIGIYNCNNCSKKFKSEKKMNKHNFRCKGLKNKGIKMDGWEESCKRCNKKFQTKCGYKRHKVACRERKKTDKRDKSEERVDIADDLFDWEPVKEDEEENQKEDIKVEQIEVEEKAEEIVNCEPPLDSFPCRLCSKKFQYERGVVMHFKKEHPMEKPLVCHVCGQHLADKLKEHLKTHGIGEEFICELCGKKFNQKFLSKIHELWHQGVEYKCSICKQKFLTQDKMEKHIRLNKCKDRQSLTKLPCDVCGKSYKSKSVLTKHYFTHTPKELRPVKNRMSCEYCGKWFDGTNGLIRHRRTHTGERPYCCRYCPKAFAQEGNCKAHERIHTGEVVRRKKCVNRSFIVGQHTVDIRKIYEKTDLQNNISHILLQPKHTIHIQTLPLN